MHLQEGNKHPHYEDEIVGVWRRVILTLRREISVSQGLNNGLVYKSRSILSSLRRLP